MNQEPDQHTLDYFKQKFKHRTGREPNEQETSCYMFGYKAAAQKFSHLQEQARAWIAVFEALQEVDEDQNLHGDCGAEAAVAYIRKLGGKVKVNVVGHALAVLGPEKGKFTMCMFSSEEVPAGTPLYDGPTSDTNQVLKNLVDALNATTWSSWQETATFGPALQAAEGMLNGQS